MRDDLYELHAKYASEIGSCTEDIGESESRSCVENGVIDPMSSLRQQASTQKVVQPRKLDLELYFEEGSYTMTPTDALSFDILSWWKQRQEKYGVLCQMAAYILVPINTMASKAAFSGGGTSD